MFLTKLSVEQIDENSFLITKPFQYLIEEKELGRDFYDEKKGKSVVTVPAGFVTDFASVPRIPFVYARYGGRGQRAAVIHDYLYAVGYNRRKSDKIFQLALLDCNLPKSISYAMWLGMRIFGGRFS